MFNIAKKPAVLYKRRLNFWPASNHVVTLDASVFRSSRSQNFYKMVFLKILQKFTEKYLYQGLYFNEVAGLQAGTLLRETPAQVFSCESVNTSSYCCCVLKSIHT